MTRRAERRARSKARSDADATTPSEARPRDAAPSDARSKARTDATRRRARRARRRSDAPRRAPDGDGRFGDVRRDDDLARAGGRSPEDAPLVPRREAAVERQDDRRSLDVSLHEASYGVDLERARHKY